MNNRQRTVRMRRLTLICCLFFMIGLPAAAVAVNPKPAPMDLVLPMPGGEEMVFRQVFIGEGDKPFALKEFKVGDQEGGYKEFPTQVTIGGAFKQSNSNEVKDWMYYMGKYEVSESQYYAIMEPSKKSDSHLPITSISWFDATEFINRYNLWLFENAETKLPRQGDLPGFLRLPTEVEWEFAARGGSAVDQVTFQGKTPYSERLSKYEWYAGPKSSHGKLKKVGMLTPNPLMIHDMLGNVSEMTCAQYMIEYSQGRSGGFVVKGGNFITSEGQVRSSLRNEVPYYKKIKGKMAATTQPVLGLRLIITAPIFSSRATSSELKSSWPEYAASRNPPGGEKDQIKKLAGQVALLEKELANKNAPTSQGVPGVMNQITTLIQGVASKQNYKEKNAAFSWIKVATDSAMMIRLRDIAEIPSKTRALATARKLGRTQLISQISKQIDQMNNNIRGLAGTISMAFEQLSALDEASVKEGYQKYITFLKTNNTANFDPDAQIRLARLLEGHYGSFRSKGKLDAEKLINDVKNFKVH